MSVTIAEPADAGAWERRLNVKKRARADGQAGVPAPEAQDWSAPEREILNLVDAARQRIEAERANLAARTEAELRRFAADPPDIEAPLAAARLDLKQIAGRFSAEVTALRQAADEARVHLAAFKSKHGIGRPAIYPASPVLQAGLLMLAAAFEALFSATLFAETEERGLLGGAVIALGLSGANVSLGFLAGFLGLRYLGHAQRLLKVLGFTAFAAAFGSALALNLFAASWRNQIATEGKSLLETIDSAALFGLTSPQAVILLMLGAGVWVFSALKGYSGFDDPYPDYGKMDRAVRDRDEALQDAVADARDEMDEAVATARARVETEIEDMRAALAPARAAYDEATGAMADLDQRLRRTCETGNTLIQLYRRENLAARTAPAPAYFAEAPPFAAPPDNALAPAADLILEARRRTEEAQTKAAAALSALTEELGQTADSLHGGAP